MNIIVSLMTCAPSVPKALGNFAEVMFPPSQSSLAHLQLLHWSFHTLEYCFPLQVLSPSSLHPLCTTRVLENTTTRKVFHPGRASALSPPCSPPYCLISLSLGQTKTPPSPFIFSLCSASWSSPKKRWALHFTFNLILFSLLLNLTQLNVIQFNFNLRPLIFWMFQRFLIMFLTPNLPRLVLNQSCGHNIGLTPYYLLWMSSHERHICAYPPFLCSNAFFGITSQVILCTFLVTHATPSSNQH